MVRTCLPCATRGRAILAVVVSCLLLSPAAPALAQYFGTNKVQYQQFDFRVLRTEHFDIYYYPEEAQAVQLAARMAERWYVRLSQVLRHRLSSRQPLILYAAHPHFRQTNVLGGQIGEGTGGVTEGNRRRVILPFAGGLAETDHVLGHEIVHAFQYDIGNSVDAEGQQAGAAIATLPLWFIEGMAEYLSLGPVDANTAMWVRDATAREKMPTVDRLDDPDFFPYRYGHAFWAYVAGRWGDAAVGDMLKVAGGSGRIDATIEAVLGVDQETFTREWHAETRRTYAPFLETTRGPDAFGRALVNRNTGGGDLNVAPALSPDGRRVVFLSSRSEFAINLYVTDVATGQQTEKLVETAGDPHFDSIEFIESAGDWAPDNRRFVFAGLSRGRPVLSILDVDRGSREAEHALDGLDQIFNPAWSPDGQRIAFSALKGGLLDLYVFEIASQRLTQLTNDAFADYDPEWAPDGRTLAFVTDRFSTNLATLDFGNYRIGRLDVQSRQVQPLAGFDAGRNSSPEFAADGTLYFIGHPDGVPNVYRVAASGGQPMRVTNVLAGISGITPATPALTVAAAANNVVFAAFEDNNYNLYAIDSPRGLTGSVAQAAERNGAVLPPFSRRTDAVAQFLQTPTEGLPPRNQPVEESPYAARLSLEAVGQPTVGIGADRFGAYAAGGISFLFRDMLGNHELGTTLQMSNRFEEIGGAVAYINRTRRWNWGLVGEQSPYVTGSFGEALVNAGGQPAILSQELRVTQTTRAMSALTQYPFSRAQRVEFAGGVRRISFDQRIESRLFSFSSGQLLESATEELPSPDPLTLGEATAALVYDTSVMGATGPLLGQRYRFEYSQLAGSIAYSGVLADYRRYFMPARPFTIALRGLHYGRYGRDSEDPRLSPLYLGDSGLLRGYEVTSFTAEECARDGGTGSCPSFDRLLGSRLALASAELRFPIVGLFNRRTLYGSLPVDIALFTDAGIAWNSDTSVLAANNRELVRSAGIGLRFNAFGYAIGEIDYVRPFDRPGRGWVWQFNLAPGF